MKKGIVLLLLLPILVRSQVLTDGKDTSFTTYSAFIKARKTQPFIRIANPRVDGIDSVMAITYVRYGNRALKMDVYFPKVRQGSLPAVLFIHGGGWASGDRSQHAPMARAVASKGYIAITVEYRLSPEAIYPAALVDLKSAIRFVRSGGFRPKVDVKKIATWGFSAGGQLAALLGTTNGTNLFGGNRGSEIQAVIDVDGTLAFIHPESGEGDESKGPSAGTRWFGAPRTAGTAKWEEAAPLNHVSKKSPPILFINSQVARMHAGRTDMIRKLDSLHIYSEVHELPDTQHTFVLFEPWFAQVADFTVGFLDRMFR